jgi:hypothetical protein
MKTKGEFQTIRRRDAARLLDRWLEHLALWEDPDFRPDAAAIVRALAADIERAQLTKLAPCRGEAHSNPHIDNCLTCAPRWGFVGPKVKVI